jgi:hypothetical protein
MPTARVIAFNPCIKVGQPDGSARDHGRERIGRIKAEKPDTRITIFESDVCANIQFVKSRESRKPGEKRQTGAYHGKRS